MRKPFELLKDKQNLVGIEVGVAEGGNAFDILSGLKIKTLYLVDIWAPYEEEGDRAFDSTALEDAAKDNLKKFKKKTVFVKKLSVDAAKDFEDNSLDFVYIDANHQYEYVKEDIEAWWPKVKVGGMLCGDDIGRKGVNKAVRERFPKTDYPLAEAVGQMRDWYEYKA